MTMYVLVEKDSGKYVSIDYGDGEYWSTVESIYNASLFNYHTAILHIETPQYVDDNKEPSLLHMIPVDVKIELLKKEKKEKKEKK